jgi:nucleotide-binding universal stress UspA family protein
MFEHARCNDRWTERREKIVRASVQVWPQPAAPGNRAPVVVCGIDGARADKEVVVFAAELTRRTGGRLILLRVQRPPLIGLEPQVAYAAPQTGPDATRDQIAAARALARLAVDAGVAESTDVRVGSGDLEQQLLTTARDEQATVLVVGSRVGSRLGLGRSLARRVIGGAPCPVVVVPVAGPHGAAASPRSSWGRAPMAFEPASDDAVPVNATNGGHVTGSILCGIDGSQHARLALRHAARLADELDVRLIVATVVQLPLPSPRVGPTADQLTGIPVDALLAAGEAILESLLDEEDIGDVERRVLLGFPGDRLADLADDEAAELIVVGSRGRGAVKAALLGSVSTDLIGVARCPVLVVPLHAEPPGAERVQTTAASMPPPT